MKGGKFLTSGAHGCIFDNKLQCTTLSNNNIEYNIYTDSLDRLNNNVVTKLTSIFHERKTEYRLKEIDISNIISTIPNYAYYFRISVAWCISSPKYIKKNESEKELQKCETYNQITNIFNNYKKYGLTLTEDTKNYIFPKNSDLDNYTKFKKYIKKKYNVDYFPVFHHMPFILQFFDKSDVTLNEFIKNIKSNNIINYLYIPYFLLNLGIGISLLNSVYLIHHDIKYNNIMITFPSKSKKK